MHKRKNALNAFVHYTRVPVRFSIHMSLPRPLNRYKRAAKPIILINGPPTNGFASGTEMLQTSRETHSFDQRTFIELKDGSQNGPHKWVLEMGLARWP